MKNLNFVAGMNKNCQVLVKNLNLEGRGWYEFAGIRKVSDESLGRDETPRHTSHEI